MPVSMVVSLTMTRPSSSSVLSPELMVRMMDLDADTSISTVVQFQAGTSAEVMQHVIESMIDSTDFIRHVFHLIPVVSLRANRATIERLASVPLIQRISSDPVVQLTSPDPALVVSQFDGFSYVHSDTILGAKSMWAQGYNGSGVVVAVIDSGAQGDHSDLHDALVGFKDFVNKHDDMNATDGIDAYDDNGHGTACAWLVAGSGASMNGTFKGMAPGASLLIIKVLDSTGSTEDSVIAQGIEFAVDNGADVISLSVGGDWSDTGYVEPSVQAVKAAVSRGVPVVIAAGNSGPGTATIATPAITEEAITVGASESSSGVAPFSSRGPVIRTLSEPQGVYAKPDVVAPGYLVVSGRWIDANTFDFPLYNSTSFGQLYTMWSGTSVAAPEVAGLIALLKSKYIGLTPLEIKTFLMAGATRLDQDYMAQGHGLANVTRTDALIQSTSRIMTITSPDRYPTLPDGPNVLIVDESNRAQNVTVLSTVNRGLTNIVITGNASIYIRVSPAQLQIQTGYTHFGIELSIPSDLPLTALGVYTGLVSLNVGDDTIATIDVKFRITMFGGHLLVDMAHQDLNDPDSPESYRYFDDALREWGILMSEFSNVNNPSTIDQSVLSMCDIFLIVDTERSYSQSEIDAIHQFVADGGVLLMVSEWYDSASSVAYFAIDSYNEILSPYGITCERYGIGDDPDDYGRVYGIDTGGVVVNHSLMSGVSNLYILYGSTLSVNESVTGTQGLFWIDPTREHAVVAIARSGRGLVIAVSDGSFMYDSVVFDATKAGADNLRLLRNIAAHLRSDRPRIQDVILKSAGPKNPANVTSYVFDEDLDTVTISIRLPNGTYIPGATLESLGYKFTRQFVAPTTGFYTVTVFANDTMGNARSFSYVFLLTATSFEEALFVTVVIILIIVVASGLGCVLLIKISSRTPQRSTRVEDEWEVPLEGGSGPTIG